jgi:hypothetical protein
MCSLQKAIVKASEYGTKQCVDEYIIFYGYIPIAVHYVIPMLWGFCLAVVLRTSRKNLV